MPAVEAGSDTIERMFGNSSGPRIVAVLSIESGGAAAALLQFGTVQQVIAYAREDLQLEQRTKDAQRAGVLQALSNSLEKAVAAAAKATPQSRPSVVYCVVGAPWSASAAGSATSHFEHPTPITDAVIGDLAKQALANEKEIEAANLLEASVTRILLNGYPTHEPAGKRAQNVEVFALISDCDPQIKSAAAEALGKSFPGTQIIWRSSARAILASAKNTDAAATSLIVEVGNESTDLIVLRKGVFHARTSIEQGVKQFLSLFGPAKPPEETISRMEMLAKDQCEEEACEELRQSIAKAEPQLVQVFGEALAKLSASRKLPDELALIAPAPLVSWLSAFFARIDFTQFTATAKPFSVRTLPITSPGTPSQKGIVPVTDPILFAASDLVNIELKA